LFLQFETNLLLRLSGTGLPIQVKDLIDWTQIIFGMAVTIQAPAHGERLFLVNHIHVVHLAVAAYATDAAIDVHRVVEIGEIGHLMDFHPIYRVPALPTVSHRGKFGVIGLNLGVTVHAGLGGWDIRMGRNLNV
jgi:hypothetical protein